MYWQARPKGLIERGVAVLEQVPGKHIQGQLRGRGQHPNRRMRPERV
jgi:hypothetical protein